MAGRVDGIDPLPVLQALLQDSTVAAAIVAAGPGHIDGPKILWANAAMAQLGGVPDADDLVNRRCLSLFDEGATEETALARVQAAVHGAGLSSLDVWIRRPNQTAYPVRLDILRVLDDLHDLTYRVFLAHDQLTQRVVERVLAELRGAARRAAHDFNNMLASLLVNLASAQDTRLLPEQRDAALRDALQAARGGKDIALRLLEAASDDTRTLSVRNTLPRLAKEAADAMRQPEAYPIFQPGNRGALLILDDDPHVLQMMGTYFEDRGYFVYATKEPGQAIARYRESTLTGRCFDLVILDLMMDEGREGLATLAALQAIDPDVRAIAHSGSVYADVMTAPTLHGFVAAIEKPTPLAQLAHKVDELLRAAP